MRVVDDAEHLGIRLADEFHAAGNAAGGEARYDGGVAHAEQLGAGDGDEGVLHVEEAGEVDGDGELPLGGLALVLLGIRAVGDEGELGAQGLDVGRPDVRVDHVTAAALDGIGARGRDGDDAFDAGSARRVKDALEVGGAEVDHGVVALGEDLELAGEVVLEGGVLDGGDVVCADVEERRDVEREAEAAVILERLARDLHHHGGEVLIAGVGEVAPEVGRLGRGVRGLDVLRAVIGVN